MWQLWSDPRQLERWWGPPGYPATFEKHELTPGGEARYFMTSPDGDMHRGMWRVTAVDAPTSLELMDAFANPDWTPVADMPQHRVVVRLAERDGGTRMEMRSEVESREDLDKLIDTGMVEGLREAVGQMDALLE